MNGILIVDKPQGFTSFDVVAKLRGICGTRKIGHGGTLDPMATGVLPVFIGTAAKGVDLQTRQDKTYEAAVLFGRRTDTGDITGQVLEERPVHITREALAGAIPGFLGEIEQLPPMYSAVKVNGKPLYRYAREGQEVRRKLRRVTIHGIDNLAQEEENVFSLRVHCSKGTYIRTLMEDMGAALGVPATLCRLRRSQAGVFGLEQAHTLDALQQARDEGRLPALLLGVDVVFGEYPVLPLEAKELRRLQNGASVGGKKTPAGLYRLYFSGRFIGLGRVVPGGVLKVEKLFVQGDVLANAD